MADSTVETDDHPPSGQPELKRAIGPGLLLFFVIGDILGTGIYALTGSVAGQIGGALWLPFLLAFAVAFITAFSYLELVGKYPRAGGRGAVHAQGVRDQLPDVHGHLHGDGLGGDVGGDRSQGLRRNLPAAVHRAADVGRSLGVRPRPRADQLPRSGSSVKANVVLTCIELSGLLLIIGVGTYAVLGGEGDASRLTQIDTGDSGVFLAITAATSLAFFAMVGFEDSVNMAEECHNPARIFPRAMLLGWASRRRSTWRSRCCRPCWSRRRTSPVPAAAPCSAFSRRARRLPAGGLRRDRALRRGQLCADQHVDG